tara:strand:- start:286 stop:429 length:144 start_codon:yes stop_codon:yes gene_type:complete
VWEDAVDDGYIDRTFVAGKGTIVSVSPEGLAFLERHGRKVPAQLATV